MSKPNSPTHHATTPGNAGRPIADRPEPRNRPGLIEWNGRSGFMAYGLEPRAFTGKEVRLIGVPYRDTDAPPREEAAKRASERRERELAEGLEPPQPTAEDEASMPRTTGAQGEVCEPMS